LIVAAEVERRYRPADSPDRNRTLHSPPRLLLDVGAMVRAIRRAVAEEHDVRVHAAVLLRAGSLPKTPSGKVQRNACQAGFLNGTLATL
jgi:acyl-coenzyme A synthetase/AMP-(fatty) acid ligase